MVEGVHGRAGTEDKRTRRAHRVVCLIAKIEPSVERSLGHPADHRRDVLAHVGPVVGPAEHVAAGDVDVVLEPHDDRPRREGLLERAVRTVDAHDVARETGGERHNLVTDLEQATGDVAGITTEVVVLARDGPDDELHREPQVDQVAVEGDDHRLEVLEEREP